ncbi:MAG: type II toxin-antitoxin system RelE/ParE family toxin [Actinobacteria bacterium]|nr:type II toxin-antitoxin system RelE/ParE family toxin [Actinomycetota bacterium]
MSVDHKDKPLVWLGGEVIPPPLTLAGRIKVGVLLRRLQRGESLGLPDSRPMPMIGSGCHELRVIDEGSNWRLVYRLDPEVIIIAAVFRKTTRATPHPVIQTCRRRFRAYDSLRTD